MDGDYDDELLLDDYDDQDGPGLFGDPSAPASPDELVEGEVPDETPGEPLAAPPARAGRRPVDTSTGAPLALYRRYRPDSFSEIIGQEHVTEPLKRALSNNKVAHAYLFSGPRGCGKTSSARILARCLNCEQGPTPTPCGVCQSCRDLATGGPGSIDVIEMDAASHGGVDDARDLRERAFFAPVASRYKIYIVDEAHMVSPQGFNAMLKIVEEPPPHVKFIFATTEPEKLIPTIRSRTHHYPFRLVPPKVLVSYLDKVCRLENVPVEPSVLPLVVRAGAGSVRDSLSVLDQLLGAADTDGVRYQQAATLLGYTPDALLDEVMDAFAAHDAGGVFASVDKVIEVGQDPRRFADDLLRRLRDLVIVASVPDAVSSGLIDVSVDQAERLQTQAAGLGQAELTRAAGVLAAGLTEMRGTTAPRLHLELMCSRILLSGADVTELGLLARMERLERRVGMAGAVAPAAEPGGSAEVHHQLVSAQPAEPPAPPAQQRPAQQRPAQQRPAQQRPAPADGGAGDQWPAARRPAGQRPPAVPPARTPPAAAPPAGGGAASGPVASGASGLGVADLRREWPRVLEEVKSRRRFSWMLLSQNAQVGELADGVLTLVFSNAGARDSFGSGGSTDVLRDSLIETLGIDLRIQTAIDPGRVPAGRDAGPGTSSGRTPRPSASGPDSGPPPSEPDPEPEPDPETDTGPSADDVILDEAGTSAVELLQRTLGAQVIDDATA